MLWFSLRAFILVFSKYKYSLETSTAMLNNTWTGINYRKNLKKKLEILRDSSEKEVYQVHSFKSTGRRENKVTWNEVSKS